MSEYPTYLIHYGVQGQKWGVRRWQNEDGSWTPEGRERYGKGGPPEKESYVLKKGSTVNRISIHKNEKLKGSKYAYTDVDKDVYEGAFAKYQKYAHGDLTKVYKKTYETKEDLIAPSDKKAKEIIDNRLKDKKVNQKVNNYMNSLINSGHPIAEKVLKNNKIKVENDEYGYPKTWEAYEKVFQKSPKEIQNKIKDELTFGTYNLMVENDKKELNKFLKDVTKQGYNAVMDYNNVKIYNDAAEPFIAINSKKTLKEIDNKLLEDELIEQSIKRLEQKMAKKGKKVAL